MEMNQGFPARTWMILAPMFYHYEQIHHAPESTMPKYYHLIAVTSRQPADGKGANKFCTSCAW